MLLRLGTKRLAFILGAVVLLVGLVSLRPSLFAEPSSWTSGDMPQIKIGQEIITSQYLMPGNRDCFNKNLQTFIYPKVISKYPIELPLQKCVVVNSLGVFAGDYLSPHTDHVYKTNVQNLTHSVIGVPNGSVFFVQRPSPQPHGINLSLYRDIRSNGTFEDSRVENGYKGIIYKFNQLKAPLRDSANQPLNIHEFAFSENGQWMIIEAGGIGLVRMNLSTEEMTLFSNETFSRGDGFFRSVHLAISNDGSSAIKSGINVGETYLYDISACQSTNSFSIHSRPTSGCQKRDLSAFLLNNARKQPADNIAFLHSMRFSPDDRSINGLVLAGPEFGAKPARKITLSLDPIPDVPPLSYVGMGDSFASGEGDMDNAFYETGTDEKGVNMCHLSKRSYPYLISDMLQIPDFHNIACSGAKSLDIDKTIQHPGSRKNTALGSWIPGLSSQLGYIQNNSPPSFITISVGGNDLEFLSILRSCLMPGTCDYAQDENTRTKFAKNIAGQYTRLKGLYESMIGHTKRETKIYVIGYPQFVEKDGDLCGINVPLDEQERLFVDKSIEYANYVIGAAAKSAGVHYVNVEDSLRFKNLCSGAPDKQMTVNGITSGDDHATPWYLNVIGNAIVPMTGSQSYMINPGLSFGNESFHPNQNGHKLLKQAILSETGGNPATFAVCANTAEKICPDSSIKIPTPDEGYFGTDAKTYVSCLNDSSCGQVTQIKSADFVEESSGGQRAANIFLEGLKSNSAAKVEIHSVPTFIGTYMVNSEGILETPITIPDSIESGYHEVHVIGQNLAGEPIDYYQPIYLTGPGGDINANDIPDEQESCGFIGDSGVDYDEDGIDDACDGKVSEPPQDFPGETEDAGTIEVVNNQNQNVSLGQSSAAGGLQTGAVSQPTGSGFQQTGSTLNGSLNGGGVGAGLNQSPSRVLSSTTVKTDETNKAPLKNDFPVFGLFALIVGFAVLAWFIQKKLFEED